MTACDSGSRLQGDVGLLFHAQLGALDKRTPPTGKPNVNLSFLDTVYKHSSKCSCSLLLHIASNDSLAGGSQQDFTTVACLDNIRVRVYVILCIHENLAPSPFSAIHLVSDAG